MDDGKSLTVEEQAHLVVEEAFIGDVGKVETFRKVRALLAKVRDEQLYRPEFETFEEYLQDRLGLNAEDVKSWMQLGL